MPPSHELVQRAALHAFMLRRHWRLMVAAARRSERVHVGGLEEALEAGGSMEVQACTPASTCCQRTSSARWSAM